MDEKVFLEEKLNAEETLQFLTKEIIAVTATLQNRRTNIQEIEDNVRADFYGVRIDDRERMNEFSQYLSIMKQAASSADVNVRLLNKYEKLLDSPYFGRFDILEDGFKHPEKIYVGYHNLYNLDDGRIYIYDWRSPVAAVFYRYETGRCHYDAPEGRIEGEMLLKRQLKFVGGELSYYADSSLVINDEILLEALSRNTTTKMRTIVETIQKEQDRIIRDIDSHALIVSGVAGSGKTNIALHRIAYLLYENKVTKLSNNNVLILSPSEVFADYIDDVLPGLGEEQVPRLTLDEIYAENLRGVNIQTKYEYLDKLATSPSDAAETLLRVYGAKTSAFAASLMEKFADLYERKLHKFHDINLDGKLLFTKEELKAMFLENTPNSSPLGKLRRIRRRVMNEASPIFNEMREKLRKIVKEKTDNKWAFEEDKRANKLLMQIKERFTKSLKKQTTINPARLYARFLCDKKLLLKLAREIDGADNLLPLFARGKNALINGYMSYPDAAAALYLAQLLTGSKAYSHYRHVLIDEAQDYGIVNYLTVKKLFPNARYTILGDVNQTIGADAPDSYFNDISNTLDLPNTAVLSLSKSYRSSAEIQHFCNMIIGKKEAEAFERTSAAPVIISENKEELLRKANEILCNCEGVTAVLTKTALEARDVYAGLLVPDKQLLTHRNAKMSKVVNVCPVYLAKGLEFDNVIIWGADSSNYSSEYDRNVLYVAASRALHRLYILHSGELTGFLK
ncbi:MAG: UvrD-helicase domain-containing protein [Defluviitaleaceae bacterium]|nr:UvrD-helicase domain-containing protein [Defluviitaleaceae bacterium]